MKLSDIYPQPVYLTELISASGVIVNQIPSLNGYATEVWVANELNTISGGGDVTLSQLITTSGDIIDQLNQISISGEGLPIAVDRSLLVYVDDHWEGTTDGIFTAYSGSFTHGLTVGTGTLHFNQEGIVFADGSEITGAPQVIGEEILYAVPSGMAWIIKPSSRLARIINDGVLHAGTPGTVTWSGMQIGLWNGEEWSVVTPPAVMYEFDGSKRDIDNNALEEGTKYDVYAKYASSTEFDFIIVPWDSTTSRRADTCILHESTRVYDSSSDGLKMRFLGSFTFDVEYTPSWTEWEQEKIYERGDIVKHDDKYYVCKCRHASDPWHSWSYDTTYSGGDVVVITDDLVEIFICLQDHTSVPESAVWWPSGGVYQHYTLGDWVWYPPEASDENERYLYTCIQEEGSLENPPTGEQTDNTWWHYERILVLNPNPSCVNEYNQFVPKYDPPVVCDYWQDMGRYENEPGLDTISDPDPWEYYWAPITNGNFPMWITNRYIMNQYIDIDVVQYFPAEGTTPVEYISNTILGPRTMNYKAPQMQCERGAAVYPGTYSESIYLPAGNYSAAGTLADSIYPDTSNTSILWNLSANSSFTLLDGTVDSRTAVESWYSVFMVASGITVLPWFSTFGLGGFDDNENMAVWVYYFEPENDDYKIITEDGQWAGYRVVRHSSGVGEGAVATIASGMVYYEHDTMIGPIAGPCLALEPAVGWSDDPVDPFSGEEYIQMVPPANVPYLYLGSVLCTSTDGKFQAFSKKGNTYKWDFPITISGYSAEDGYCGLVNFSRAAIPTAKSYNFALKIKSSGVCDYLGVVFDDYWGDDGVKYYYPTKGLDNPEISIPFYGFSSDECEFTYLRCIKYNVDGETGELVESPADESWVIMTGFQD